MEALLASPPPEVSTDEASMKRFEEWKAMGAGGLSHDWAGYLVNLKAEQRLACGVDDTVDINVYKDPAKLEPQWESATEAQRANAAKSYLGEQPLPERAGPRARALPFALPHRERNADVPIHPEVKKALLEAYEQLGRFDEQRTEWKTSELEKRGRALFLRESVPLTALGPPSCREVCHVHTSDLTCHVTLSYADAIEVISKGWGERHRMSGTPVLNLGFTLLYVPNTVEEVAVIARLLQAGLDYMLDV
ncbi:hypothetical protein GGR56DRAFT_673144 [Xylariaceae sp. FL0804]|nr:hypothetical protein GGR56DRAFT_673144 [Xylariaceae sp. FL0804]